MSIKDAIAAGLRQLDLDDPGDAAERLADYIALLAHWNRAYNLTAVRRPEDMVARHVLDSLSILPWLKGPRVVDVGSGAGLPGIPLALLRPHWSFVLLDSNGKRTRFLTQAVADLGLAKVRVLRRRVEEYRPAQPFDTVVSRAFSGLADFVGRAGHLCASDGQLLAMKGAHAGGELAGLPPGYRVARLQSLTVPTLGAGRHVIQMVPSLQASDSRFEDADPDNPGNASWAK